MSRNVPESADLTFFVCPKTPQKVNGVPNHCWIGGETRSIIWLGIPLVRQVEKGVARERTVAESEIGKVRSSGMIVQEQGGQLILIRQTDHAVLSGFLAREWGNELFKRPEPFESVRLAAAEHDNGWREWELQPQIDPRTRLPYSFMSLPTETHIALYQRGIERVAKIDRYAGLLVSLHASQLYDRARATIPGYSAKYVKATETELVSGFLQNLKLQQLRLKVDLRAEAATKDFAQEKLLEINSRRLEALDRLSLYFCLSTPEEATMEAVPVDDQGSEVDWELRPQGNGAVSLAPYPFRRDPLTISILARRVPKRVYTDDGDFQKTLARAQYSAINFTLYAGGALSASRFAVA
jgi:hypothetical protein